MEILEFGMRLSAALLLGAAVGIERQWRQKSAGLRTNTLVSLGAAAFTLISFSLTSLEDGVYKGDATRIIGQIVTGIGFLGAGVIMKDGLSVRGLNTAATIWCSAAVGSLCGVGLYAEAAFVASGIILTHILLRPVGIQLGRWNFVQSTNQQTDYLFIIKCKTTVENHIRVLLMQMLGNEEKIVLQSLTSDDTDDAFNVIIQAAIKAATRQDSLIEQIASRLTIEEKVIKVSWEIIETESEL